MQASFPPFLRPNPLYSPAESAESLASRASKIRLLLLDVDGVLSDGRLYFSNSGEEMKTFHTLDGQGIRYAQAADIQIGIITGRESALLTRRCRDLDITIVHQGVKDKGVVLDALCEELDCKPESIAYMGDDFPDVAVMRRVGFAASVPAGHLSARSVAHSVTEASGGSGAVRELIDFLLQCQNKLPY